MAEQGHGRRRRVGDCLSRVKKLGGWRLVGWVLTWWPSTRSCRVSTVWPYEYEKEEETKGHGEDKHRSWQCGPNIE